MPQETADRKRVTALGQFVDRCLNGLDEFSIERPLALAITFDTRLPVTPQVRATLRALDDRQLCPKRFLIMDWANPILSLIHI